MKVLIILTSWLLVVFAQTDSTLEVAQHRLIHAQYGPETAARHLQRLNEQQSDTTLQYVGILKELQSEVDSVKGKYDVKIKDATKDMNDFYTGIEGVEKPTKAKKDSSNLGKK